MPRRHKGLSACSPRRRPYRCQGCDEPFSRDGLPRHLSQSRDPRCVAYAQEWHQDTSDSGSSSSANTHKIPTTPSRLHQPALSPSPNEHLDDKALPKEPDDVENTFRGDYFGADYGSQDFPGWDNGDAADQPREPDGNDESGEGECVRREAEEEMAEEGELHYGDRPDLGQRWEPEPTPPLPNKSSSPMLEDLGLDADTEQDPPIDNESLRRKPEKIVPFGKEAGKVFNTRRDQQTQFNPYSTLGASDSQNIYAPFISRMDWEVARWAKLQGPGSTSVSELLHINGVSLWPDRALGSLMLMQYALQVVDQLKLSYKNSRELNQIIDTHLPTRRPRFRRIEVSVDAANEAFDVYFRDIIECIKALFGDPEFAPYLVFAPERHYADGNQTIRLFHDMHTGRWWWNTQVSFI